MKVLLFSTDEELFRLCRESMIGLPVPELELKPGSPEDDSAPADVYIRDLTRNPILPTAVSVKAGHILVVNRQDLPVLGAGANLASCNILLKPVSAVALRAFLEDAAVRYKSRHAVGLPGTPTTDSRDILQSLLSANLRLQEHEQDRTNFLARALHDLRTPLMALDGYCRLLVNQKLGDLSPEQMDVLRRMQRSIERLSRLSDGMFHLSVRGHKETTPDLRRGDIVSCLRQALHEITPQTGQKQIRIYEAIQPPERPLSFEASQIEQLLTNLLDNACKFTPSRGSIEVIGRPYFWNRRRVSVDGFRLERRRAVSNAPNAYRIEVRDSGPGIPSEVVDKIFEEHITYSGPQDRSGGGLGLAICKTILQAHRGAVWAEPSEQGASFCFVLPFVSLDQESRLAS
jgi:signal transduction histidine kinase